jgi:hypothetical protein
VGTGGITLAEDYVHRVLTNVALPYKTFNSAVSTDPLFEAGINVMTNQKGESAVFPGFADALEAVATAFTSLQRIFIFKKWNNGPYIAMFSDLSGGLAKVYKYAIGVDVSASLIFTSASSETFDFIDDNNWVYFGNGTEMMKFDGTLLKSWGLIAPLNAPTIGTSGTGITAYAGGWYYVITSFDSVTGHESSPSDLSACTANVSNKTINVSWTPADIDQYADEVRIYRTTDGGSTNPLQMALVATVAKGTGTYADTTLDANLSAVTFAPATFRNDPPPPAKGFAKYSGRIYMFSGDTVYFTGREEIANGVPFDCVPGGLDGNYARFDGQIEGLGSRQEGVAIFLGRKIWALDGATLDTMYPYLLLDRRGALYRSAITSLGTSIAWFDTSHQVWLDGAEIGKDIRPDLLNIDPTQVSLTVHISGEYHWLILCDKARGRLFVFDLDTQQWMPPRQCGAKFVYSNNTSDTQIDLLIARNGTKVLKMTPATLTDDGTAYTSFATTNLWDMTPQQSPEWRGWCRHIGIESNQTIPDTCSLLVDDDPDFAAYTPLTTQQEAPLRKPGTYIKETWFMGEFLDTTPGGRRVSFRLDWSDSTTNWKWLSLDVAIEPAVGQ